MVNKDVYINKHNKLETIQSKKKRKLNYGHTIMSIYKAKLDFLMLSMIFRLFVE